jgi:uncharacterized membrane protein (UPF0127 family)
MVARPACLVRHRESGRLLAVRCRIAGTFWARLRGWVGYLPQPGDGLWVRPCGLIHTFGMRVPIDIIFCGGDGTVRRVVPSLRPGRTAMASGSTQVCELPAGQAAGIAPGHHLDLV